MKHFYFKFPTEDTAAFEACLATWSKAGRQGPRPATVVDGPAGTCLKIPARDLAAFCSVATATLDAFTRRRLQDAARIYQNGGRSPQPSHAGGPRHGRHDG